MISKKDIDRFVRILESQQNSINEGNTKNISDWDKYTLTLSMASIGFCFSFLPIKESEFKCIMIMAVILFVVSILFTMFTYMVASKGYTKTNQDNSKLLGKAIAIQSFHDYREDLKLDEMKESNPEKYNKVSKLLEEDYNKLRKGIDFDNPFPYLDDFNKKIELLNNFRGYSFALAVILVCVYAFVNFNLLGK